jgi:hypothetical protein
LHACKKARHLTFTTTSSPGERVGFPKFDPDEPRPYSPTTQILFPVILLYPQYNQSDFIPTFAEHTTFGDQFEAIFPRDGRGPDWDVKHEYISGKLNVYVTTRKKRMLKIGMKMTLADVFLQAGPSSEASQSPLANADGLEVSDGCLHFIVFPRNSDVEKKYIENFKKERDQLSSLSSS